MGKLAAGATLGEKVKESSESVGLIHRGPWISAARVTEIQPIVQTEGLRDGPADPEF